MWVKTRAETPGIVITKIRAPKGRQSLSDTHSLSGSSVAPPGLWIIRGCLRGASAPGYHRAGPSALVFGQRLTTRAYFFVTYTKYDPPRSLPAVLLNHDCRRGLSPFFRSTANVAHMSVGAIFFVSS